MEQKNIALANHLKGRGVKPSYQRLKIYEFLLDNRIHPTVDAIYKKLSPQIPTLSKTTVYNTLNLFVEKEMLNVIVIDENQTRYDIDRSLHGHFKCNECNEIYDIKLSDEILSGEKLQKFNINEYHLYFKGSCKTCESVK